MAESCRLISSGEAAHRASKLTNSKYPMGFTYSGGCSGGAPGQCVAAQQCPGAFWGSDTENGTPVNCVWSNAGVGRLPSGRSRGNEWADGRLQSRLAKLALAAKRLVRVARFGMNGRSRGILYKLDMRQQCESFD
jgi:hypothetical protein